jgi:FtsP/CotA-like multicopper oxidase with cupredoxin domain
MNKSRRDFLRGAFTATALLGAAGIAKAQSNESSHLGHETTGGEGNETTPSPDQSSGTALLSIETPDIPKLPWRMDNGVKVFHLVAEVVKREFLPGKVFDVWGYNGSVPGPTIEVNQGDRVRIIVENRLPEPTSMHWHGF